MDGAIGSGQIMEVLERPVKNVHLSQRTSARSDVKIMANIRVSGGLRGKVRIVDLSRTGFQMECLSFMPSDRPIFLTMPGFMHLESRIVWHSDWHYGCAFASPLNFAVYEHIVHCYPAIAQTGY